jgi:hypothetical protein
MMQVTRQTKWTPETITAALADAQISDRFSALSQRDAIRFLEIGTDHGMSIAITLRHDGFAATIQND